LKKRFKEGGCPSNFGALQSPGLGIILLYWKGGMVGGIADGAVGGAKDRWRVGTTNGDGGEMYGAWNCGRLGVFWG